VLDGSRYLLPSFQVVWWLVPTPAAGRASDRRRLIQTPFESFQGDADTPVGSSTRPPTNSDGTPGRGTETPLSALLFCVQFGGLGLLAVQGQRRSLRR